MNLKLDKLESALLCAQDLLYQEQETLADTGGILGQMYENVMGEITEALLEINRMKEYNHKNQVQQFRGYTIDYIKFLAEEYFRYKLYDEQAYHILLNLVHCYDDKYGINDELVREAIYEFINKKKEHI